MNFIDSFKAFIVGMGGCLDLFGTQFPRDWDMEDLVDGKITAEEYDRRKREQDRKAIESDWKNVIGN